MGGYKTSPNGPLIHWNQNPALFADITRNSVSSAPTFTPTFTPSGPPPAAPTFPSRASGTTPYLTDPGYQASLAAQQLGVSQVDNATRDAITRYLVNYGDPSFAAQAGFGLDPQSAAFAQQNYLSGNATLARLDKAHTQARQAVINQLAGHGLLNSGDLGYQEGQADQSYGNQVYDAQQALLDAINGVQQSSLSQKLQLQQGVQQALESAWANYLNNPSMYGSAFANTTVPANTNAPAGTLPKGVTQQQVDASLAANPYASHGGYEGPTVMPSNEEIYKAAGGHAPPPPKPSKAKAVAKALENPYSTGRKRFG